MIWKRILVVKLYREVASTSEGTDKDAAKKGTCSSNPMKLAFSHKLPSASSHISCSQWRVWCPVKHGANALLRRGPQLRNPRINGSEQADWSLPVARDSALVRLLGVEAYRETPGGGCRALGHVVTVKV